MSRTIRVEIRMTEHTLEAFDLLLDEFEFSKATRGELADAGVTLGRLLNHCAELKHITRVVEDPEQAIPLDRSSDFRTTYF